jgi:hypothetical protein
MFQKKYFSRDEWRERGRVVTAPNEEAKTVVNFYLPGRYGVAGARHVFAQDQTVPVEQFRQIGQAA